MKTIVLYASKSGNTKKVAEAIAEALNCKAHELGKNANIDLNDYDLIFLGSGVTFSNPNENVINYLQSTESKTPKRFALFLTWGGAGQTDKQAIDRLQKLLHAKNHIKLPDFFRCLGGRKFALASRGHPNSDDLAAAKKWAKNITDVSS